MNKLLKNFSWSKLPGLHFFVIGFIMASAMISGYFIGAAQAAALNPDVIVAAPVVPGPMDELYKTIFTILVGIVTAFLAWISRNAKEWVKQKSSEANTDESAKWAATALYFAGVGVRYAEGKYGPDSGKGKEKKEAAVKYLTDRIKAWDKTFFEKNKDAEQQIEDLVDAAYADIFLIVSPLAGTPGQASAQA